MKRSEQGNVIVLLLLVGAILTSIVLVAAFGLDRLFPKLELSAVEYKCHDKVCKIKYRVLSKSDTEETCVVLLSIYEIIDGKEELVKISSIDLTTRPRGDGYYWVNYTYDVKPVRIEIELE